MQLFYVNRILINDFIQENCLPECPLEESYLEYLKNSKLTNFLNDFVTTQIDEAKESFVYLNIFYKELSYDISTESLQMSPITLISNIARNTI